MDYVSQTNGAFLRDLRIKHGEKQDELARAIHVSRQLLSMWEHDRARATESSIADIAAHYCLNIDTVMDGYFCAPSAEVYPAEDAEPETDAVSEMEAASEVAVTEAAEKAPRRGVSPIIWTGLIAAAAVAVVYGIAAYVLWGIVFPRALEDATMQTVVVVNVPVLAVCLAVILICVSALAMFLHWLLRKVLRRNKNQEG